MNTWVYDIETYPNCFQIVFYNIKTFQWKVFEISDRLNEEDELIKFLDTKPSLIGFNNINFDYPLLHNTILRRKGNTALSIYKEATRIIEAEYSAIWDNQVKIPQLDLYKIWHYDNKNKRTSLKWLEFAMRSKDVRDLPYKPGTYLTEEQMDTLLSYCKHDVKETYNFLQHSLKHIELRKFYTSQEGINLMNASEVKLAKEVFAKYLSKEMGITTKAIKQLRTFRSDIPIKDIIFKYIKFNNYNNQAVLDYFNNFTWRKGYKLKYSTKYLNVKREYGEGGLHSFGDKSCIYESNEEYLLVDVDFASFYPHISFKNNLHPAHIPANIFNKLYEGFYHERKKYPKSDPRNYVLKIILNGSYGLSKDMYSFLYDPKWQLAITVNGQLILTILTEYIVESLSECKIVFENTDGAMYYIKRNELDNLKEACNKIAEIINIPLEINIINKIIARDVNNYITIDENNKYKFKGAFEIDRDFHKNHSKRIVPIALANYFINEINPENTIYEHISNLNALGEDSYSFCKNYGIYDFCLGAKMKGNNTLYSRDVPGSLKKFSETFKREYVKRYEWYGHGVNGQDSWRHDDWEGNMAGTNNLDNIFWYAYKKDGNSIYNIKPIDTELARMNRYYVSNDGVELIKKLPPLERNKMTETDKFKQSHPNQMNMFDIIEDVKVEPKWREENLEAGYKCTIFNKYQDLSEKDYNINYDYYINEAKKIIKLFE